MPTLFSPLQLGDLTLANRIVMAPMTRSRAINNLANDLIETYYTQRASAGLIITEAVAVSPDGLGYARIPAIYNNEQTESWKKITQAVHDKGGRIFMQLVHTGRIGHPFNNPKGATILAPSAVQPAGQVWTDKAGMQDYPTPKAMTQKDVKKAIHEHATAAQNAMSAGFDGVEIHAASGYLPNQFLSTNANLRKDIYGGDHKNRARFIIQLVRAVTKAIGSDKVGIKLSPGMSFNDVQISDAPTLFSYLAEKLSAFQLAYLHVASPPNYTEFDVFNTIRKHYKGTLILGCAFDKEKGENLIKSNIADAIAYGALFLANPDLPQRFKINAPFNTPNRATFYAGGAEGLIDYPTLSA